MRLKVTLQRPATGDVDLVVDVDGAVTVGAMAAALTAADPTSTRTSSRPQTLSVQGVAQAATVLDPHLSLAEARVASGQYLSTVPTRSGSGGSAAVLTVHAGPDAGRTFDLARGLNTIGRRSSCDVTLTDRLVSQHHAKLIVGSTVELVDDNSSNGILVGADQVQRIVLRPGDRVVLGESVISVTMRHVPKDSPVSSGAIEYNRSPIVAPVWEGLELQAPEPPRPSKPQRFPIAMAIAPIFMGALLWAITGNWQSVLFVALSPLMFIGSYYENKRVAKLTLIEDTRTFKENLAELVVELARAQDVERLGRNAEHPSTGRVVDAVRLLEPLVWTRRPEHDAFLTVRLGLGRQPSRTTVELPSNREGLAECRRELLAAVAPYETVDQVPVVADLRSCGSLGVSGPDELRWSIARGLLGQIVSLHSPAEVVVAAMASPQSATQWDWLKWLPHVGGDHQPFDGPALATTEPACAALAAALTDLLATRSEAAEERTSTAAAPLPAVILLVEDDAPVERNLVVALMERGRALGIHVVWSARTTARVPAAARTFLEIDPAAGALAGKVIEAEVAQPIVIEPLDLAGADWLARRLAPVVDAGAQTDTASDVPRSVSFLADLGASLADDPSAVVDRWNESNSLLVKGAPPKRLKRDNTLRAYVGRSATDPVHLDLRAQGPHALVGGTTGAGKSEFLQTWVLGMATAHSPQRVTFLYVDYKGGSAFADCVSLPHSVGLVTDLSPHLVQRALISLNAELRHREHILNRKRAKDLLELERRGDPECPPSLIIVVDEFAALVQEVPEFVDGVVNVAQRGRSLGLHLILATQRPAGVIKDNLRANTNLRVALRMADEEDSKDVVGTAIAGTFDPAIPGRGVVKTGPGRLALFQAGYVGGWTSGEEPLPQARIATLAFGTEEEWVPPDPVAAVVDDDPGAPDIQRVVTNVVAAAARVGLEAPRKPWLPELAPTYALENLPTPRRDSQIVVGVADLPEEQRQDTIAFHPDVDGNVAVFGTGGAGKSTFLRTLAISAGFTARSGPCHVYGLDFGSRGLTMLEALPHVGAIVGADDAERTARLISQLRETLDERAVRYAALDAGTIEEYRRLAGAPDEPRLLLLVDGFAAFRSAYETGFSARVFDQLVSLAVDGRPVGIHLAIAADRVGAIPAALASSIQRKLALRLSNEMDEAMLAVPRDGFGDATPPGRGFYDGREIQVALLGGDADVAAQAEAVRSLAASMVRAGTAPAPTVERLADRVELAALPAEVGGLPTLGVADDDLQAAGFAPTGFLLVAGPSGSGRSTAVRTMVASLRRSGRPRSFAYLGNPRSPLARLAWDRAATGPADSATLAEALVGEWASGSSDPSTWVIVLDGLGEFLNSEADYPLQELLKACRTHGAFVIADGETSDVNGSWPLLQAIKGARHGLVLQPDQTDGDTLFRTTFPRLSRAEFPEGRGMYVRAGRVRRVQVALAPEG